MSQSLSPPSQHTGLVEKIVRPANLREKEKTLIVLVMHSHKTTVVKYSPFLAEASRPQNSHPLLINSCSSYAYTTTVSKGYIVQREPKSAQKFLLDKNSKFLSLLFKISRVARDG